MLLVSLDDLNALRRVHHVEEADCWFSCPLSGECCSDESPNQEPKQCTCGATAHNLKIDQIIASSKKEA